jgi:hypothetical protein
MKLVLALLTVGAAASEALADLSIVDTRPGAFTDIAGAPGATFIDSLDDSSHTIVTTVGNVAAPAGNVSVCNNGYVRFFMADPVSGSSHAVNQTIPALGHPANLLSNPSGALYPWWDDLLPIAAPDSGIWWQEVGDTLIIQWQDQRAFGVTGDTVRFQVKVFNTGTNGDILAQYIYDDTEFAVGAAANNGGAGTIGYSTRNPPPDPLLDNVLWSHNMQTIQAGTVLSLITGAVDTDGDGLTDDDEVNLHATDPFNPDTDSDGLLDGTEVDMAMGGGCPSPIDADSDNDSLTDGAEVAGGTMPCNADSDGDGVNDAVDPTPSDPGVPGSFIEGALRAEGEMVGQIDLAVISAPNNNAAAGRRNALSNKLTSAANKVAEGDVQGAIDELTDLREKLDGLAPPTDWMHDGMAKDDLRSQIDLMIALLHALV